MGPSELGVSRGSVSRRHVLRGAALSTLAGLSGACAPAAVAPPPAAAPPQSAPAGQARPAWEQDWEKLVAAAKQEGKVSVITRPGASYRKFLRSFEEAFPGIVAEQQEMLAIQLAPRLLQERNGGIYNWDAMVSTSSTPLLVLRPAGALDPLRPALMRPDILQDNVWRDGFDGGWTDTAKSLAYAFGQTLLRTVWVNTDLVRTDEIKTARDLLDPKWKGRMVAGDPRTTAFSVPATSMRLAHGDDIVKRVYKDQETVLNKEYRVMTEALIKGKYAIGIQAVSEQLMQDMLAPPSQCNQSVPELDPHQGRPKRLDQSDGRQQPAAGCAARRSERGPETRQTVPGGRCGSVASIGTADHRAGQKGAGLARTSGHLSAK